jgi:hypothetical protein
MGPAILSQGHADLETRDRLASPGGSSFLLGERGEQFHSDAARLCRNGCRSSPQEKVSGGNPSPTRAREGVTCGGTHPPPPAGAMAGSPMKRMRKAGVTDPVTGELNSFPLHAACRRSPARVAAFLTGPKDRASHRHGSLLQGPVVAMGRARPAALLHEGASASCFLSDLPQGDARRRACAGNSPRARSGAAP